MEEKKHELETRDWGFLRMINYRGCIVTKIYLGYQVFKKCVGTPEEVDGVIDESLKAVEKSLNQ